MTNLLNSIITFITSILNYKEEKVKNATNIEVIDDKNKLELAVYHAKKAFTILDRNNYVISTKNVMFRYHLKKFYKYI